jgi:hypothetical protein
MADATIANAPQKLTIIAPKEQSLMVSAQIS